MLPNCLILCCPLSLCLQSFPASGCFPVSQLFPLNGQSIGASVFASVLSMHIQGSSPLGLTGLNSLQSKGLLRVFSNTTIQKHQFFHTQPSTYWVQFSSVAQSCPTLRPRELQHARPPCPSPTPGVHSDSCPWSQWCHPGISSLSSPSPPAPNPSQHQSLF